jgi:hypothetical protein
VQDVAGWGAGSGGVALVSDWKVDLDALVRETMLFVASVKSEPVDPRALARGMAERTVPTPLDRWVGSEREEIKKRVASFKAHQQRLIHDREEYAASQLSRMRRPLSP